MILTQVTLEVQKTVKKPNGAEHQTLVNYTLPAEKQRISQSRLDEFSMVGLAKRNRWVLYNLGELEDLVFQFFYDEKGTKYNTSMWERDPNNNNMTLEGIVANGI